MAGHECYHCKRWIEEGEAHDCWTTTEAALTRDLAEDLQDAWARLRESAADLGEQRIYASHNSIMFSRRSCYAFVRPKKTFLEVCLFLGRALKAPEVRRASPVSKHKIAHLFRITHRDEVEAPFTDWLQEAYGLSEAPVAKVTKPAVKSAAKPATRTPAKRTSTADATRKPLPKVKSKRKATRPARGTTKRR